MNRKQKLLILFEIPLILVVVCQAWSKPFPVAVYLAASALLGVLIAMAILIQHNRRVFTFIQMILLAVLVRNIYYIATHYSVIPYGDAYTDYALMRTYMQSGQFSIIPTAADHFTNLLSMYSGWPGLAILGASLSHITNIDPFYIAILLPQLIFLSWFYVAYCLLRKLENDLGLSSLVTNIALLVIATSPFLMQPPAFYHQDMGTLFLMTTFLLIYRQVTKPTYTNGIVLILVIGALVITHHYTSFILVLYLSLFSILVLVGRYFRAKSPNGIFQGFQLPTFFTLSLVAALIVFLWWTNVTVLIGPRIASHIKNFIEILKTTHFTPAAPVGTFNLSPSLKPSWAPVILYGRDVLTYIPTILGFLLLWKKGKPILAKFFILFSLLTASIPLGIDVFFGTQVGLVYRGIFLFMPFIALSAGIFYQRIMNYWKRFSIVALAAVITLLSFASLTGLWAHNYVPIHLYDPAVSWIQGGEHPTYWNRLSGLFENYVVYDDLDQILTDDWYPLSVILPLDQCKKLYAVNFKMASLSGKTITVAFRDLSVASYNIQAGPYEISSKFDPIEFKQELDNRCNCIVNSGEFKVWWGSN